MFLRWSSFHHTAPYYQNVNVNVFKRLDFSFCECFYFKLTNHEAHQRHWAGFCSLPAGLFSLSHLCIILDEEIRPRRIGPPLPSRLFNPYRRIRKGPRCVWKCAHRLKLQPPVRCDALVTSENSSTPLQHLAGEMNRMWKGQRWLKNNPVVWFR